MDDLNDHSTEAAESLLNPHPSEAAYRKTLPELEAMADGELAAINLDVVSAVTMVLGVLPEVLALRPAIESELRRFDFRQLDGLERYALALNHAHTLWRTASVQKGELTELARRMEVVRDRLLLEAQALAAYGLVSGDRLNEVKAQPGYKPMASDVLMLVNLLKRNWPAIQDKTPATIESLNGVATEALELLAAIGEKNEAPPTPVEAALTRQRAFTLFKNAYDAVRRAVVYVRDVQGDADDIAPSLYAGRGGSRRRTPAATAPAAEPATTREQSAVPSNGSQPVALSVDNAAGLPITHPLQN